MRCLSHIRQKKLILYIVCRIELLFLLRSQLNKYFYRYYLLLGPSNTSISSPLFAVGVIADTQYCDREDSQFYGFGYYLDDKNRKSSKTGLPCLRRYRQSLEILDHAVTSFLSYSVSCCVHLGDVLDKQARIDPGLSDASQNLQVCKDKVMAQINRIPVDWHYLIGNNDLQCFTRQQWISDFVPNSIKATVDITPSRLYYSFAPHPGFQFILLDAFDESALNNTATDTAGNCGSASSAEAYGRAQQLLKLCSTSHDCDDELQKFKQFNGGVGPEQLQWLEETLAAADAAGERCLVFSHLPIYVRCCRLDALMWNNLEVTD